MLTVQEAADSVRLTQWAIYRAIQRGDLAAYKPGGRLRIREDDLDAWLESTRVQAKRARRRARYRHGDRRARRRRRVRAPRSTACGRACGRAEANEPPA